MSGLRGVIFTVFAWAALTRAIAAASYPTFSLPDLQADFDQLQTILNAQHPRLYTDRAALDHAFVTQRAALRAGMSELEFLRVLSPLVAALNCGHSAIDLSAAPQSASAGQRRLLPLSITLIEGKLFVDRAPSELAQLVGAEILAINGLSAAEVISQLYANTPADGANLTLKQHRLSGGTRFSSAYHAYVDATERFNLIYHAAPDRANGSVVLDGRLAGELGALQEPGRELVDGIGWSQFGDDYALLRIATFNFYDAAGHSRFNAFIDQFFNTVAARQSPHVILDLRGNGGGDPYCGAYLMSHLLHDAQPYFAATTPYYPDLRLPQPPAANAFRGPATVLIDGGCFSTTGHVVSLLRYHQRGAFIGEETGGSFVCTAATQDVALTHTQLRLRYATLAFATAASGLAPGRGIFPDQTVVPTIEDRIATRDVALEFALSQLRVPGATPVIRNGPASPTIANGDTVVLAIDASGAALRYQWNREGHAIEGATGRSLVLTGAATADAGHYSVTVTNPNGTVTSSTANLGMRPATDAGRLSNVSVRTFTAAGDETLIVGFALGASSPGPTAEVLVRGVGPELSAFGLPSLLSDPRLDVFQQGSGKLVAANDDWANSAIVGNATAQVGAFPFLNPSGKDAALVTALTSGTYSAQIAGTTATGLTGSVLAEMYDATPPERLGTAPQLRNVSARAHVNSATPLIAGFVIGGTTAKTMLIRGIGPGLQAFVGARCIEDPNLTVFRHVNATAATIATNADWAGDPTLAAIARRVGAFALTEATSKDAIVLATLDPGVYTVHVSAESGQDGLALAEVYVVP